jgi:DNA polymerase gamma 1
MPCVTPSQPTPIPSGESLSIEDVLDKTGGGTLFADGSSMDREASMPGLDDGPATSALLSSAAAKGGYVPPKPRHRATDEWFLEAQAARTLPTVKKLWAQSRYDDEKRSNVW